VLKHFAEQVATESQVVVLSHLRTIPRGWTAMRAELGFDGRAHDLLVDRVFPASLHEINFPGCYSIRRQQ